MDFPVNFIQDISAYYSSDNIYTSAGGQPTNKQYQAVGLRQGCNMSSILFDLYISLGDRLSNTKAGLKLKDNLVNNLMFADDILVCASNASELDLVKRQVEEWCEDHKMSMSPI
jgi:hypothetical protein